MGQVDGLAEQTGGTVVGTDPEVLRSGCSRVGGAVDQPLLELPAAQWHGGGVPDPEHAERQLVVLGVDEGEPAGMVAGRHRPATVEGAAEHRDEADEHGGGGQP